MGLKIKSLIFILWADLAFASPVSHPVTELGGCQQQIDPVHRSEEYFVRQEAEKAGLNQVEVLARLIYSESLSTGYWKKRCEAPSSEKLMEAIGWGILNRVELIKSHPNPYTEVIFKKNQFRTSFSSKKKNPFAIAFLCPNRAEDYLQGISADLSAVALYQQAQRVAHQLVSEYQKKGIPLRLRGITHFFYPRSEFFGELKPTWAVKAKEVNLFNSKNPCVEFYRLK